MKPAGGRLNIINSSFLPVKDIRSVEAAASPIVSPTIAATSNSNTVHGIGSTTMYSSVMFLISPFKITEYNIEHTPVTISGGSQLNVSSSKVTLSGGMSEKE